jgi:hypothetical protein
MLLAIFGIDNTGLSLAVTFAILALVAIWIALIVFTFTDARRRISDPFLVGCATAASFFPFVGTVVYSILRPPEFLDDAEERETEMKAAETRTRHLDASSCRKCAFPVQPDFVRCPACRTRLKDPCPSCSRPVGLKWKVCPYCEHTLIESKRSRTSQRGDSGAPAKRAPSRQAADAPAKRAPSRQAADAPAAAKSPERSSRTSRSARKAASAAEKPTRAESSSRSKSDAAERSSRRKDASERPVRAGRESGREETAERPARSAARSGRRRVVVSDDEPGNTINGGNSTPRDGQTDTD